MRCEECREQFTDHVEGTLSESNEHALQQHLQECDACADDLERFRKTLDILQEVEPVPAPDGLYAHIQAGIDSHVGEAVADEGSRGRERVTGWSWQRVGALAAAAVVLAGLVVVLQQGVWTPTGSFRSSAEGVRVGEMAAGEMREPAPGESAEVAAEAPEGEGAAEAEAAGKQAIADTGEAAPQEASVPKAGPAGGEPSAAATKPVEQPAKKRPSPDAAAEEQAAGGGRRRPGESTGVEQPRSMARALAVGAGESETDKGTAASKKAREGEQELTEEYADRANGETAVSEKRRSVQLSQKHRTTHADSAMSMVEGEVGPPGPRGARGPVAPQAPKPSGMKAKTYAADEIAAETAPAAPEADTDRDKPVHVDLTFLLPKRRERKSEVLGAVTVRSSVGLERAVVKVRPSEGLRVANASEQGVLYRGRLPADEPSTFLTRLVAEKPGEATLRISLSSELSEASADLTTQIPGLKAEPQADSGKETEPAESQRVSVVFKETPIRYALIEVSRQTGVRIALGEDVGGYRVSEEFQDVRAEAVLRILCEEAGLKLSKTDSGYAVTKP